MKRRAALPALLALAALLACGDTGSGGEGGAGSTGGPAGDTGTAQTSGGASSSGDPGESSSESSADSSGGENPEPYTVTLLDGAWFSGSGQQLYDSELDLGEGPFERVTLGIELESPCYPFDKWDADPPPPGENWPASCDAFDRLMYFVLDQPTTDGDPPGFEVLRSITPFGGPLERNADLTDFANAHPGAHTLSSYISTWEDAAGQVSGSAGGYFMTVRVEIDPGPAPRQVLAAVPLWFGPVGDETALGELPFVLPEGTTSTRVEYRVTGHGGGSDPSAACIGPAEEFCERTHHLTVDGVDVIPPRAGGPTFVPWRSNCVDLCTLTPGHPFGGSYCAENPQGAVSSVQAPRANWCPGDDVDPIAGPLPAAASAAGEHALGFAIDGIHADGTWWVSLSVYAFGD
jgi:hypothetical protein